MGGGVLWYRSWKLEVAKFVVDVLRDGNPLVVWDFAVGDVGGLGLEMAMAIKRGGCVGFDGGKESDGGNF